MNNLSYTFFVDTPISPSYWIVSLNHPLLCRTLSYPSWSWTRTCSI